MKKIIFSLLLLFLGHWAFAMSGTITNIFLLPIADGSGMIDVYSDLSDEAQNNNILIEVSFDAGDTHTSIPTAYLTGNLQGVNPGCRYLVWDGYGSFPNEFSIQTRIQTEVTAVDKDGDNGQPSAGVTDIDGNFYPSVIIGNQEWMAENLRVTRDASGNEITRYCYNNDTTNCALYGGLYTWHTMMNDATSSNTIPSNVQGICPTGWHVPSDEEWAALVDYVVEQGYPDERNNPNGAGNALKSCRQVSSPLGGDCATSEHPRWNSHSNHYGRDEFGFSALPVGYRNNSGAYKLLGYYGYWWSSSETYETSSPSAWSRTLSTDYGAVNANINNKESGFSVRCVRDN